MRGLNSLSWLLSVLLPSVLALALSSCASSNYDETADWKPEKLYAEAKEQLNGKLYEKAISLYEKLEGRAAVSILSQQAQIEKAYAQYKSGDPIMAVSTLDRFIKVNPASPALDYAYYLKGVANFNDDLGFLSSFTNQDLSERDQKAAKESFDAFRELLIRFPNSKYAEDARLRMLYEVNVLAQSEVNVARYYFKKGAYIAAINRAQAAINEYRGVPAIHEALLIIRDAYGHLGLSQLKEDTQRIIASSFPQAADKQLDAFIKPRGWWQIW